jgi:hypothetical protein
MELTQWPIEFPESIYDLRKHHEPVVELRGVPFESMETSRGNRRAV